MAKRIRVEFELDESDVKKMIKSAAKGAKKMAPAEIRKLKEKGVIRAVDILEPGQIAAINKFVIKLIPYRYVDKLKFSAFQVKIGPKMQPAFEPAYKPRAISKATRPKK